ncbi:MAG TPA: HD domain-containing phosphohydrolase [Planctomycetota bacterium]|nr:HD domain-containing phosphohydrolase [Planctomycetota bacterium]
MTPVLVIDDEAVVRNLMVEILSRAGYEAIAADSARGALELLDDPELALVVSDIVMPGLSGFELLDEVHARRPSLPVLLVTGSGTEDNLQEALAHGAAGLITKPFSHAQLRDSVAEILSRAESGEREVRTRVIAPALTDALTGAVTARDETTGSHVDRLVALAVCLGEALGLSPRELDTLRLGASLHDIGKIGIPDRVLQKPGPLDFEERTLMRAHPVIGERLLERVDELAAARDIVRHHHERWDGSGYPDGLAGEDISLLARVVAVADGIEAMAARRPYRSPLTRDEILQELKKGRGTQWDPEIVDVATRLIEAGQIELGPDGYRVVQGPR